MAIVRIAVIAAALLGGVGLSSGAASADPTVAGDPFDANEIAYLNDIHRFSASMGVSGDDETLVQDGYYACHLQALSGPGGGPPPAAYGISPLITTYAIKYFCPERG